MDDIRPPRHMPRRDYTLPVRPAPAAPVHQPGSEAVRHHAVQAEAYHRPPVHHQNSQHHQAAPPPAHPAKKRLGRRPLKAAALVALAAGLFLAGYLLKPKSAANSLPTAVVSRAKFSVYFPSPMPAGYKYVGQTATFQIGDVFYRFASGSKSVTVKEEPLPAKKPNLGLLAGYSRFKTAFGQAALGSSFGQPTAVVVTSSTVITMNTGGGVAPQDLKTAIENLKNIGQNTDNQQ